MATLAYHRPHLAVVSLCLAMAGLLCGCQQKETAFGGGAVRSMAMAMPEAAPMQPARRGDSLAYEHEIAVELDEEILPARLREIEAACTAAAASSCVILEVALHSNQNVPGGFIRMRLAPGGVEALVNLSSKDGEILSRNTRAEDLAQPIADTQRQLQLLTVHRDRLAEFMKSKEIKVEQLITVSKELAGVQAQIESLGAEHATLRRRIDTDLLTIRLSAPQESFLAQQTPVRDALGSFGANFREAVGMVIRFVAILLPWLVIIIPGLILVRMLWRWIGRWLARREQRRERGAVHSSH